GLSIGAVGREFPGNEGLELDEGIAAGVVECGDEEGEGADGEDAGHRGDEGVGGKAVGCGAGHAGGDVVGAESGDGCQRRDDVEDETRLLVRLEGIYGDEEDARNGKL